MKRISRFLPSFALLLCAMLVLQACNSLDPLCGSARPAPDIASLSPSTVTFAQVQQGLVMTVNGTHFVASSVVLINGTTLTTTVLSSTQLQVALTDAVITTTGTASVTVNTPGGNSSSIGCTSGGTSHALTLTIT
jgi:IPT/TIG domain